MTASPLRNAIDNLARPVSVLTGEELDARRAGTLGETLERQSGVQSSYFGAGVGRPIIRGQDGARVQVLSSGSSSLDVSTVSADHAVTIEPFLADQIEVLKGPATLLYGSGAIGGAVNVVDGRIPTAQVGRTASGRAEIRHGSAADENVGMARLDADAGALTLHVDAFRRDSGDYRIPGFAFSPALVAEELAEGEELEHFARGRLPNSALTTQGGGIGASWFGERAWFGGSAGTYRTNYGIPPGAHAHEEDGGEPAEEEEPEVVRLDMRQDRFEFRGGLRELGPLQEINYRVTRSLYEHTEFEGEAVGTVFENLGTEARIEAVQNEINGWRGAIGLQYGHRDFSAIGDEAFVPPSISRDVGLFVLQERDFGDFKLELGARHDRVSVDPESGGSVKRNATSLARGRPVALQRSDAPEPEPGPRRARADGRGAVLRRPAHRHAELRDRRRRPGRGNLHQRRARPAPAPGPLRGQGVGVPVQLRRLHLPGRHRRRAGRPARARLGAGRRHVHRLGARGHAWTCSRTPAGCGS